MPLKMFTLTNDIAATVFLINVTGLVSERSAELVRSLNAEFVLPFTNLGVNIGETICEGNNCYSSTIITLRSFTLVPVSPVSKSASYSSSNG